MYVMSKYGIKMNKALDLNVNYTLMGTEKKLHTLARPLYTEKKAFIIHSYTPSFDLALFDLDRMTLPFNPSGLFSDPCFLEARCDGFVDVLLAIMHSKINDKIPELLLFVKSIDLDRTDVNQILAIYSEINDD